MYSCFGVLVLLYSKYIISSLPHLPSWGNYITLPSLRRLRWQQCHSWPITAAAASLQVATAGVKRSPLYAKLLPYAASQTSSFTMYIVYSMQ